MGSDYMDNNELECILKMLDWNSSKEIQKKGRKKAEKIKDLNMFIQPVDKKYNKNVWENCAIILQNKSDEELSPYLERILEWLQDINWPGAELILERMLSSNQTAVNRNFQMYFSGIFSGSRCQIPRKTSRTS